MNTFTQKLYQFKDKYFKKLYSNTTIIAAGTGCLLTLAIKASQHIGILEGSTDAYYAMSYGVLGYTSLVILFNIIRYTYEQVKINQIKKLDNGQYGYELYNRIENRHFFKEHVIHSYTYIMFCSYAVSMYALFNDINIPHFHEPHGPGLANFISLFAEIGACLTLKGVDFLNMWRLNKEKTNLTSELETIYQNERNQNQDLDNSQLKEYLLENNREYKYKTMLSNQINNRLENIDNVYKILSESTTTLFIITGFIAIGLKFGTNIQIANFAFFLMQVVVSLGLLANDARVKCNKLENNNHSYARNFVSALKEKFFTPVHASYIIGSFAAMIPFIISMAQLHSFSKGITDAAMAQGMIVQKSSLFAIGIGLIGYNLYNVLRRPSSEQRQSNNESSVRIEEISDIETAMTSLVPTSLRNNASIIQETPTDAPALVTQETQTLIEAPAETHTEIRTLERELTLANIVDSKASSSQPSIDQTEIISNELSRSNSRASLLVNSDRSDISYEVSPNNSVSPKNLMSRFAAIITNMSPPSPSIRHSVHSSPSPAISPAKQQSPKANSPSIS